MRYASRLGALCCITVLLLAPGILLAGEAEPAAIQGAWLAKNLPDEVAGFERSATQIVKHEDPVFTEVSARFSGKEGSSINVFLGDLGKTPDLLKDFLKARGLTQSSVAGAGNVSIEAVQASDDPTTVVQDSPARIHLQASADKEPTSLSAPDIKISEHLRLDLRQSSGRGILETASPSDTLLLHIPQMSADKEQASPTGELITISAASIDATMEEQKLTVSPEELQLSETRSEESFVQPYKELEHDIAGWQLFDAKMKAGVLILAVADRFALLVEGDGIDSLKVLEKVVHQIDIGKLEAAVTGKKMKQKKQKKTEESSK